LGTKSNTVVILSTAAATLLVLSVATVGHTTTIFAQLGLPHFTAKLSGSNEVPPVNTTGSGIASFQVSAVGYRLIMNYQLHLKHMNAVTGVNIHSGKRNENGPIVARLFTPPKAPPKGAINVYGTLTSSGLTGQLKDKTIDILVNMIRSGGAYVNVHTTKNHNGEVRGQIL
jgi:hypothetical protein